MRINGITVQGVEDIGPGRYFLVRVTDNRHGGAESYSLYTHPGRTNQSHEERIDGWLGSTNDISRHAEGAVEVYLDTAGRLRVRRTDAQALWDEDDNRID